MAFSDHVFSAGFGIVGFLLALWVLPDDMFPAGVSLLFVALQGAFLGGFACWLLERFAGWLGRSLARRRS